MNGRVLSAMRERAAWSLPKKALQKSALSATAALADDGF
jgi:hypothetical protein